MRKKEEKIFITDNPLAQSSLKNDVLKAFERCNKLETLVKDFGLPLTREIVSDCLTLRKETKQIPAEGTAKFVGEKSEAERFQKEFVPVEVWANSEHIQAAFDAMLQEVNAQGGRTADIVQRKESLKSGFNKLLEDIYGVFHVNLLTIKTDALLRYFDIESEKIILVSDFDERLKADTATYATTEGAKSACVLHREIAKQLNTLADLMKNVPRNEFAEELDKLFYQSEDGTIQATPIDYDLFT
ncbi:hypothetical protein SAMN04488494_1015 [Xylanibacter ruminicola]|uniref:Uncharacterized protein n=1 Tax=Xylanibacter ruminicola TaxID=839 RepID=A0A1M7EAR9_XYLRU|nr:hypothetical protein [Xylanibacter ruminicola]SFC15642.1 hypothetical protein SAMN04488493_103324 [Xylanibacter ruminicola]SHL88843.1 hypothetical protein SAMN04488494_1015 [Xylanibacter ruminicola]